MIVTWKLPDHPRCSALCEEMLQQVHLLIAGASGSGKSTVLNGIMQAALAHSPVRYQFILIDPKGTELKEYRRLPHTLRYAQSSADCLEALRYALEITSRRFRTMQRGSQRLSDEPDVYVIIDELMYLFNRREIKREALETLQDILVIARAAHVHVIACTQNPTTATIPVTLRCNFDSRLALRTATAQDSRNILGVKMCETFPVPSIEHRALGAIMQNGLIRTETLPPADDEERSRLIQYWIHTRPKHRLFA